MMETITSARFIISSLGWILIILEEVITAIKVFFLGKFGIIELRSWEFCPKNIGFSGYNVDSLNEKTFFSYLNAINGAPRSYLAVLGWSNACIHNSNIWPNGVIPSFRGRRKWGKTVLKLSKISKSVGSAHEAWK